MNKHFEDARYYLKRAGETATKGIKEELEPLQERFNDMVGEEEEEPEPSRMEKLQGDLKDLQERAEGDAKEAIADARGKLASYRQQKD
ncbi:hypothetical protein ACKVMT_06665 [Halobacteriales archaeon Cl-PHB]